MPEDPIGDKAGNTTRCFQLLQYFQKNNESLDTEFISFNVWKDDSIKKFHQIFPSIKLTIVRRQGPKTKSYLKYFIIDKLPRIISRLFKGATISRCTPYINRHFKKAVRGKKYDISLISYAYWGELLKFIDSSYSINDTHDFVTKQNLVINKYQPKKIGKMFQNELTILREFHEIWSYSVEEHFIFDQFLQNKVRLMPISYPFHQLDADRNIEYDVLYVASDNPHNKESIKWFIENVLPKLENVKITAIGKICKLIPDHPAIQKLGVVEDLSEYYQKSKITICPMISGTGIKIKVLESLSYGLPVVTSRRGVDGLLNKSKNGCLVADDAVSFADYIERLLNDPILYSRLSMEGSEFFQENYSKEHELSLLNNVFLVKA